MTNTTKHQNFQFRTKFEKKFAEAIASHRQNIEDAFSMFCQMKEDVAEDFIWKLSYRPLEETYDMFEMLGLEEGIISSDNISSFRAELLHQYKKLHPGFGDVAIHESCKKAFNVLSGCTSTTVANKLFKKCVIKLQFSSNEDVERTLYLLKSEKEENFFGGIRDLNFCYNASLYLKAFHQQIYDLLKAVYEESKKQQALEVSFGNKPFKALGEHEWSEEQQEVPESEQTDGQGGHESISNTPMTTEQAKDSCAAEEMTEVPEKAEKTAEVSANEAMSTFTSVFQKEFTPLTAENILKHQKAFEDFVKTGDFNYLGEFAKFGFDLNLILKKESKIGILLEAIEKFEG